MGSYIEVDRKFTLFSIIIALYLITRSVEADLPNKDIMNVASCLREFFGEKIATEFLKKNGDTLTDGEYFKIHCDEVDDEDFYELVKNKTAEDYDGTNIKKCLAKTNSENLFQKYVDSVASNQNDDQEKPETHRTKSVQNLNLVDTPAVKFFRGACQADFKPMKIYYLSDENERAEAVKCLAKCANKFLFRIKSSLNSARDGAIKSPLNQLSQNEIERLKKIPDPSREFTTEKFYSALEKANEPLSIDWISQIGKEYLMSYNELYYNLDRYIDDTVRHTVTEVAHINFNLSSMHSLYQECAKLECAMDSYSTPLNSLIKSATNDSYSTILKTFDNDKEEVRNWVDLHTGDWRKFCQALMG